MSAPQQQQDQSEFMKSIKNFIATKDDPNSLLSNARNLSKENANEIDKQLETFETDMKKVEQGKMSYAEMRALYG